LFTITPELERVLELKINILGTNNYRATQNNTKRNTNTTK
jgi:hypothetical protein